MEILGKLLIPFGRFIPKPDEASKPVMSHVHVRERMDETVIEATDGVVAGRLVVPLASDIACLVEKDAISRLKPKDEVHLDRKGNGGPQHLSGPFEVSLDRDDGKGQCDEAFVDLDLVFERLPLKTGKFGFNVRALGRLLKLADGLGVKTLEIRIPGARDATFAYANGTDKAEREFIGAIAMVDMFAEQIPDDGDGEAGEDPPATETAAEAA